MSVKLTISKISEHNKRLVGVLIECFVGNYEDIFMKNVRFALRKLFGFVIPYRITGELKRLER